MKKIVVVLLLMNVLQVNINAQTPNWVWGKQATANGIFISQHEGMGVATDNFGNVYATGSFDSVMNFGLFTLPHVRGWDIFLVKYSSSGNFLWATSAGGTGNDQSFSVATDALGNVFLTGSFTSPTITFGTFTLTNSGSSDVFIVKYSSTGTILWAKSMGGSGMETGYSVATDASNNVYVTGTFASSTITVGSTVLTNAGSSNIFLVKYDINGNILWAKREGGIGSDIGYSLTIDASYNIYLTGYFTSSTLSFGSIVLSNSGGQDMFIVKYNNSQNVLWAKNSIGTGTDYASSIAIDVSGFIYVTGYFNSPNIAFGNFNITNTSLTPSGSNGYDLYLVKYNSLGTELFVKIVGGKHNEKGYSVATDNSGVYITGGLIGTPQDTQIYIDSNTYNIPSPSGDPMCLIKYDFNGNPICVSILTGGGDDISCIATDNFGNAYLSGDLLGNMPYIFGADTLTRLNTEYFFIAKYNCNTSPEGINEITKEESLTLYPNPATTSFTIESTNKIQSIKVINVIGEEIITNYESALRQAQGDRSTNNATIDVSGIAKGIYFVQITTTSAGSVNGNTVVNKKIVVQ